LSTSPTLPTPAQLATTRLKQWHQNGEALLTFENLRSWINAAGLALYNPRAQQLPTPAPSMVEAVLGASNAAPTPSDAEQARSLLARLIAEGAAVPLNLLGNPTGVGTDTPDFIAATAILPYIFTLRGDKSWKQPPTTSGATKVSPLALATYELLSARAKEPIPGLSASALATELGKEVTTAAVLRSLTELWQHLRVLPIPQQDGAPTLWELTSARFTKQLKAGANAGQPTALSALISLYLGQSIVATEAEIETFLSPLAARTRVRDVVHALLAARRLETIAIEGRTVLHVTGDLPAFLCEPTPNTHIVDGIEVAVPIDDIDHLVVTTEGPVSAASLADSESPEPRIKKFIPKPRKIGTGFVTKTRPELAKPARKPFGDKSERSFGTKPAERTRRPFTREGSAERPTFNKPWEEEKIARLSAASAPSSVPESDEGSAPTESGEATFRKPSFSKSKFGGKPAFGAKRSFGDKPSFGAKRSFGDKPAFGAKRDFSSDRGESRPPRRDFGDKPAFDRKRSFGDKPAFEAKRSFSSDRGSDSRPPRRDFGDKPSYGAKRNFSSDRGGDARPPRRDFGDKPAFDRKRSFGDKPSFGTKRSFSSDRSDSRPPRRNAEGTEAAAPRYRKFDAPRTPRPFNPDRPARPARSEFSGSYAGKREGGYAAKSEGYKGKTSGGYKGKSTSSYAGKSEGYKGKSAGGYKGRSTAEGSTERKPYSKSPRSEGSYAGKSEGGYAGKSEGYKGKSASGYKGKSSTSYAGKSDGYKGKTSGGYKGKSTGPSARSGKPASTFDKFKDNKKPFGKRPPARKWKPEEAKSE
jgi:23S rRNA pseudouridine2605 synthase